MSSSSFTICPLSHHTFYDHNGFSFRNFLVLPERLSFISSNREVCFWAVLYAREWPTDSRRHWRSSRVSHRSWQRACEERHHIPVGQVYLRPPGVLPEYPFPPSRRHPGRVNRGGAVQGLSAWLWYSSLSFFILLIEPRLMIKQQVRRPWKPP